jgi:hypothetical protein
MAGLRLGHPRLSCLRAAKTWMPGTRPVMTSLAIKRQFQIRLRDPAARCARVVLERCALGKQRAWGMPGARRTRSLVCSVEVAHECSHHGRTGTPGIPARNGFNGLFRALPGDRACLSPSFADMACLRPVGPTYLRKLDAGVEASGPHDFAVREKRRSSARR